jgi:hypothetical protein
MNGLATGQGAGVQPFRKLGELVLGDVCPWVSRELAANMFTPLMKKATGNDARPVSAKDCDYAVWMKSIHRTVFKSVSQNVRPQQLGVVVPAGLDAKKLVFGMSIEECLATGRGGVVVKDDRKNAHNTFDNKSQVLAARDMPGAALFARISDILARTNAEVFTWITENPYEARLLRTIKTGASRGTP